MSMNDCQIDQWKGCCCNCKFQAEVRKHPWNKSFGKGSITKNLGYGCMADGDPEENIGMPTRIIFFDHGHGYCEMFSARNVPAA